MNLMGTYRAVHSDEFVARVTAAIVLTAQDIINSDLPLESSKRNHALEVMRLPDSHMWITQFVWRVAANAAIASTVGDDGTVTATDNDIHYVVSGAWNDLFPEPVV